MWSQPRKQMGKVEGKILAKWQGQDTISSILLNLNQGNVEYPLMCSCGGPMPDLQSPTPEQGPSPIPACKGF